jgi:hypothetical protein
MPRFPVTRLVNCGGDQIRLRLLAGTSALNQTLSKFSDRDSKCPFEVCDGAIETPEHFLLHCKGVSEPRAILLKRLWNACTHKRRVGSGGEQGCAEFFEELDEAGKALFILGGPVDGRCPELGIDGCASEFVRAAYELRSKVLTDQAEEPVTDLTSQSFTKTTDLKSSVDRKQATGPTLVASRRGCITSFFLPVSPRSRYCMHGTRIAQSNNGVTPTVTAGSGLNGSPTRRN